MTPLGEFTEFIFELLISDLKNDALVQRWEASSKKTLTIQLKFNEDAAGVKKKPARKPQSGTEDDASFSDEQLIELWNQVKRFLDAGNPPPAGIDVKALNAAIDRRSRASSKPKPQGKNKPWWKFWG